MYLSPQAWEFGYSRSRTPVYEQPLKVAGHSFGILWVYVICQIMARERLQLTSWNLASEKYTDEKFDWQLKFDVFLVSMAKWMIEYNFKISLLLSLHKIR